MNSNWCSIAEGPYLLIHDCLVSKISTIDLISSHKTWLMLWQFLRHTICESFLVYCKLDFSLPGLLVLSFRNHLQSFSFRRFFVIWELEDHELILNNHLAWRKNMLDLTKICLRLKGLWAGRRWAENVPELWSPLCTKASSLSPPQRLHRAAGSGHP